MGTILVKRVYEPADKKDGFRILVDRLWPRGIKKELLQVDIWMKEVAPSPALRIWFNHDPGKWIAFGKAYIIELKKSAAVKKLIQYCKENKTVTLLYSAKDEQHNQALVLQQFLSGLLKSK